MDSYSDYDQAFTSSVKSSKTSYTSPKQTRTIAYETDLKEIDQYLQYGSDFDDIRSENTRVKSTYTSPKQTRTIAYETDIRENGQHVHYNTNSDRVNADLRSENDRLALKLSEKMRTIEEWKRKYSELEASSSNVESLYAENANLNVEIHRLKDELSRVRSGETDIHKLKTHIEIISREKNELHVLLSEKENIIVQLRNDLETSKGLRRRVESNEHNFESSRIALIEKDNVISELRLKLSRLEEQVLSVNEWKTKSLTIAAENQRLIRALEERGKEIEMMRVRTSSSVEHVNVVNVVSVQEKKLEAMLIEKTREIEALRVRLNEKERERVVVSPVKSEYQEKYVLISSENEKLNAVICAKQKEIETLTVKLNQYHEVEAKLKLLIQEKNKLVIERDSVVQERTRLESRLIEKDHAYDVLRVKIREAEKPSQEFVELKQRLAIVLSENERLGAFIVQKKKEIEILNARSLEYHDLELKLKLSIEENNELVVQKEAAVEEKTRLEALIAEISEEYEALSFKFRETERIYSEIADLKSKLSVTISENERLSVLVIEREKELKCLETEIVQYKVSIEEYKQTIENHKRVIEDGKRVIVEKEREFESHKSTHVVKTIESHENVVRHQAASPVVVIKQESQVMSSEVARLERELCMRESQVRQLEQRVAILLIQNKQLMQEREIIDTTFSCEVKELESLRLRSSELSILNMQLRMYEEEKEETLKLMDKDRRLFEKSLYEKELVIKEFQAKGLAHEQRVAYFSELKARLARITNENERLVIEIQEKSREIDTLRTEVHQLNVRNSTRVVVQETHTSEILLNDKAREISSLKARIVELEKGSYLADELSEKLRLSTTKYESIIANLNIRLSEMEALRVRCTQLSDLETRLTLVTRERDEAVNYERLNRIELASYQEKIVRLEAQVVELRSYKQHNISSPKIVHVETNKTFEKEAELNLCRQEIARYQEKVVKLEAQITELSVLKQHQVQILNTPAPAKVVQVETRNVEKENELSKVIIQLKEKLEVASKEIERLNIVVSQKETQIVSLKKVESSKNTETLVVVQREKEELVKEKNRLSIMCEEYVREIEVLRLKVNEIEVFGIEKQRLLEIISTKTREIQMLEQTLAVFESEKLSLKQIACEKEKIIEEMELKLFAKNSVNEVRMNHQVSFGGSEAKRQLKNSATEKTLKSKLSYMSGFNDEFESILVEREQLEAQVAEKQKNIKELQIKVASAEKELVGSGELKSKVTLLDSESKRLNNVAMERLAKLNASEQQLRESTKEKSLLGIEVSEKQVEVNVLRTKVCDLEVKAKLVTELQGKLAMMVLENDRLTKDLDEKNQFIKDLKSKYATLESLYLLVRGNMKKPEAVEKKYQDMIGAIEQVEHKLGLYGRSKAMKKTISVQSILQMDVGQSQAYSLSVSPLSESKIMVESKALSATTKSTPTMQIQKAMF